MSGMRQSVTRLSIALGFAAVSLLAGCNKKPTEQAMTADGAAKPASAADVATMSPLTQKPGLWELTNSVEGMPKGIVSKLCMDKGISEKLTEVGIKSMGGTQCSQSHPVRTGNTMELDAKCTMPNQVIDSHIRMEVISDSEYKQTVHSTMTPAMNGRSESTMTVVGKRLGDCPADMKAGDMILPGGMKMNMYDMLDKMGAKKVG